MIVVEFHSMCSITAYHYNIICDLVLMTSIVHFCSITAIEHYFDQLWLGVLRAGFLLGTMILGIQLFVQRAREHFPLALPDDRSEMQNTTMALAAVCMMDDSPLLANGTANGVGGSKFFTSAFVEYMLMIIFFVVAIIVSIRHTHNWKKDTDFERTEASYIIRGLLMVGAIGITIHVIYGVANLRSEMHSSGLFADDDSETSMDSFGQIIPLIMLALPVIQLIETSFGKYFSMLIWSSELILPFRCIWCHEGHSRR